MVGDISEKVKDTIALLVDNKDGNIIDGFSDTDAADIACRIVDFVSNATEQKYDNQFIASGIFAVIYVSGWYDDDAHAIAEAVWDIFFSEKYPY